MPSVFCHEVSNPVAPHPRRICPVWGRVWRARYHWRRTAVRAHGGGRCVCFRRRTSTPPTIIACRAGCWRVSGTCWPCPAGSTCPRRRNCGARSFAACNPACGRNPCPPMPGSNSSTAPRPASLVRAEWAKRPKQRRALGRAPRSSTRSGSSRQTGGSARRKSPCRRRRRRAGCETLRIHCFPCAPKRCRLVGLFGKTEAVYLAASLNDSDHLGEF